MLLWKLTTDLSWMVHYLLRCQLGRGCNFHSDSAQYHPALPKASVGAEQSLVMDISWQQPALEHSGMERLDQPADHGGLINLHCCILDWNSQDYKDRLDSGCADVSDQCINKRFTMGNALRILPSNTCRGGVYPYGSAQGPIAKETNK